MQVSIPADSAAAAEQARTQNLKKPPLLVLSVIL
mgnify:CR=1 FL=1